MPLNEQQVKAGKKWVEKHKVKCPVCGSEKVSIWGTTGLAEKLSPGQVGGTVNDFKIAVFGCSECGYYLLIDADIAKIPFPK